MSRLLSVGWDTLAPSELTHPALVAGSPTSDTANVRNVGSYTNKGCLKCDSGAGNNATAIRWLPGTYPWVTSSQAGIWYYQRSYFMFPAAPATYAWFAGLYRGAVNINGIVIASNTNNTIDTVLYQNNVQTLRSAIFTYEPGVWFRMEIGLYIDAGTATNGAYEIRIEGVRVDGGTGMNFQTTAIDTSSVGWWTQPGANKVVYIDDYALNDSKGADQNSWPGEGKLLLLKPVSDVARGANWVAGAGSTSNLFDAVDNRPPVGVALGSATNTSQVKNVTSDTTGNYDLLTQSPNAVGISPNDKVILAHSIRSQGCDSATSTPGIYLDVSNPAGAADLSVDFNLGGIAGTYPTNWAWLFNTPIYKPYIDRNIGSVLRIGKRSASTRAAMADFMGMYLEVAPDPDLTSGMLPPTKRYLSGYAPDQDKSALTLLPPAINLIENPSFETDLSSWGIFGTGTSALRIATDAAPGQGSACVEITFNGVNDYGINWNYYVEPGREYVLSGWIKRPNSSGGWTLIQFYDGNSQFNAASLPGAIFLSAGNNNTWTFYQQTFTIPNNIVNPVGIFLYGSNSPTGTVRFDGIGLRPNKNRGFLSGVVT